MSGSSGESSGNSGSSDAQRARREGASDSDNEAQLRIDRMLDEEKRPLDSRSKANQEPQREENRRTQGKKQGAGTTDATESHPPYETDRDAGL